MSMRIAVRASLPGDGVPVLPAVRGLAVLLMLVSSAGYTGPAWSQQDEDDEAVAAEALDEEAADEQEMVDEAAAEDDDPTAAADDESDDDAMAETDAIEQDEEPDLQAESAPDDEEDSAAEAGLVAEDSTADDDAETEGDFVAYSDGSSAADEFMSTDWAPDVFVDPADDAVPVDVSLDPAGLGWEVVPSVPSGAGAGKRKDAAVSDVAGRAEILQMRPRTAGAARSQPGSRSARPGASSSDGGKDTAYSFGGQPIKPGFAPWQAQIYRSAATEKPGVPRWKAQHNCGGTLIAPGWILTAAHCIDDILDDREAGWRVRLGGQDLSKDDGVTYAVDRWVRHSQYKNVPHPDPPGSPLPPPNMYGNDIGLIHIRADAQTRPLADPKRVQPITLYRKPVRGGDEVTAIGWGMTENVAKSFSAVPLKVDLRVMDTPVCQARPGYGPQRVNAGVICAAREGQKTCRGDSGGPVILTNGTTAQLVGIVSWGKRDCAGDGRPSVFTRLESHLSWIEQAMKLPETRASLP